MIRKWILSLTALLIGFVLAVLAIVPPAPKGLDAPLDQFSSARAMKDVHIIAAKPHPTGSTENAKVRAYLTDRLTVLGMEVSTTTSLLPERALKRLNGWSGETKTEQSIVNVIGVLHGKDRTKPALLLMAHHDTVWGSPGAADDTVGIASILEIVRALKTGDNSKRDLIVLFTDAEEVGLSGASHFFKKNALRNKIGTVINFEARGGGRTANMFQTSDNNGDAIRLFARSVKEPSVSSLSTFVYEILPNDTDLTPALEKNYTAYNIANIGRAEYYHSPKIDAEALSERTLQHMGSQGLDLTRALLSAEAFPAKTDNATFFDVFGFFTLIYAPFWGWIFLAVTALCFGLSVKGDLRPKDIMNGALKMLVFLGLGGGLLFALNALSGNNNASDYYDRLAAIPKLELTALFLCIAVFFIIFGQKTLSKNARLGAALPILALGIAGQALAPTATYFITVPLMLCGTTCLLIEQWPDKKISTALIVFLTALVFGYMLYLNHLLMVGVGPNLLAIAILPTAIAVLAIIPLYQGLSKRGSYSLGIAGIVLAIGMAAWIRLDPIASTVPLY